jgi:hypothetical protein
MYLKLLKTIKIVNGMLIASRKVPVMNRLLGKIQVSRMKNRHPARATAIERPSKGMNRPGKV